MHLGALGKNIFYPDFSTTLCFKPIFVSLGGLKNQDYTVFITKINLLPLIWLMLVFQLNQDHVTGNAELEEKARLTMKSNFRSSVSISSGYIGQQKKG